MRELLCRGPIEKIIACDWSGWRYQLHAEDSSNAAESDSANSYKWEDRDGAQEISMCAEHFVHFHIGQPDSRMAMC